MTAHHPQVTSVLQDTMARAHRLLGERLVSVVLYGSRARGDARPDSDFDLLIIADSLPDEKQRRELALDITEVGFDYGLPVQVLLVTPEEAEQAVATGAPLMFEIYDAHRLVYDQEDFFRHLTERFASQLRTWRARKIKERVWEVPGLATVRPS